MGPVILGLCESGPVTHCVSGQAAGDVKGILEESTISFISLPESTLQDLELSRTQTPDTGSAAQEVESEGREVCADVCGAAACVSFRANEYCLL